jgi:hypothetical protein
MRVGAIDIFASAYVAPGQIVLWREGVVVWIGPMDSPIEDAVCDCITVSLVDYKQLRKRIDAKKTSRPASARDPHADRQRRPLGPRRF